MFALKTWQQHLGCPAITAVILLCVTGADSHGQPVNSIAQGEDVEIEQRLGVQVPLDVTFRDERGRNVQLGPLIDGRPVILNLVYFECPMLCNLAMDGLIRSLRSLPYDVGDELTVITVSFDPREGPELAAAAKRTAIKRYGRPRAEGHWHFLTGDRVQIERLCNAVGFQYRWDPERKQYAHAAGIIVLTPQGVTSRYLFGVEYAPRDLRLSLVEAADNKIGGLTDQVLLLCYQYDPTTGKYGLLIQRVLRWAGIATVGLLGGAVGLMLWNERRQLRRGQPPAAPRIEAQPSPSPMRPSITDHED
jgi:protein SCO1/2